MPYLSKAQIAAAREMDLLTYLRQSEPEELVHIGGGTYAKSMPNLVAFGPIFPGDEVREHKPDEYMEIERVLQNAEIIAAAMYELAK